MKSYVFAKNLTITDQLEMSELKLSQLNLNSSIINELLSSDPIIFDLKSDEFIKCMKPVEPGSEIHILVPKYYPKERKVPKYLLHKPKEPKFIPYEPYKAAVLPIKQNRFKQKIIDEMKNGRNNFEIQKLVEQVSEMRRVAMNEIEKMTEENEGALKLKQKWEKEKETYETDIKNLRETNAHLENQLKFQAQVNSELKTLLVAAVGEDLESRVQHLTEDKLALARALLNSANHLTSHQEQTEWLSGQCEVWRSKFLASSLMVEELAKWKTALTRALNDLREATQTLIQERRKIHTQSMKMYCYLKGIVEKTTHERSAITLKHRNIVEVTAANQEIVAQLKQRFDIIDDVIYETYKENKTIHPTNAERKVEKILQTPVTITNTGDALCSAVMGAASSSAGQQSYINFTNAHHCAHCKGEIQNI